MLQAILNISLNTSKLVKGHLFYLQTYVLAFNEFAGNYWGYNEHKLPNDENHFIEGISLITLVDSSLSLVCVLRLVIVVVCVLSVAVCRFCLLYFLDHEF